MNDSQDKKWRFYVCNITTFFQYVGIGLTSWLLTNSLFIQVPNFAEVLPEGYAIASQISLIIQITNVFAVLYVLFHQYIRVPDWILILCLQLCAIATAVAIAFSWDVIWRDHSVVLLILSGCSGFIGCMSVVIFYPFSAKSSPFLTSAISLGMGLTGLVSSLLGIIQGVYPYSVQNYFLLNALILFGSLICLISVLVMSRKETKQTQSTVEDIELDYSENSIGSEPLTPLNHSISNFSIALIITQLFNCFVYYFLLGVVPYTVNDFDNSSELLSLMYDWGLVFGSLGRFLCTFRFFRSKSNIVIYGCIGVQYCLGIFIFSQCVWFWVDSKYIWTVIISYIVLSAINGYEDTLLYQIAAVIQNDPRNIERVTRFIGLSNQGGAFCGSILSFVLIELQWIS